MTVSILDGTGTEPTNGSVVWTQSSVAVPSQTVPDSAFANGANFTEIVAIPIGDWPSGYYDLKLTAEDTTGSFHWPFVIRESDPGSTSPVLAVLPVEVWQAYNYWPNTGGRSLYRSAAVNDISERTYFVHYERPYHNSDGIPGKFSDFDWHMIEWLNTTGHVLEFALSIDIERNPGLLDKYEAVTFWGHDEYWGETRRNAVLDYIASGQEVAFFTGNTCWWHVRYSATDSSQMICYKDTLQDVNSYLWSWEGNYTNELSGTDFNFALDSQRDASGWAVRQSSHYIFDGTGLVDGDTLAAYYYDRPGGAGSELDGLRLDVDTTGTAPGAEDYANGTPVNCTVLAVGPAMTYAGVSANQNAAIVYYTVGPGSVFSVGYWQWPKELSPDSLNTNIRTITSNILGAFEDQSECR